MYPNLYKNDPNNTKKMKGTSMFH